MSSRPCAGTQTTIPTSTALALSAREEITLQVNVDDGFKLHACKLCFLTISQQLKITKCKVIMKAFPGTSFSSQYSTPKVTSLNSNSCTASLPLIALYPKSALSLLPKALISITSRGIKFQIFAAASGFHTQVTDTSLASPHVVQATRCSATRQNQSTRLSGYVQAPKCLM